MGEFNLFSSLFFSSCITFSDILLASIASFSSLESIFNSAMTSIFRYSETILSEHLSIIFTAFATLEILFSFFNYCYRRSKRGHDIWLSASFPALSKVDETRAWGEKRLGAGAESGIKEETDFKEELFDQIELR